MLFMKELVLKLHLRKPAAELIRTINIVVKCIVNKAMCCLKQLKWYNRNQVEKIMALKLNSCGTISFYFHFNFLQTEVPYLKLAYIQTFQNLRVFRNTCNSTTVFHVSDLIEDIRNGTPYSRRSKSLILFIRFPVVCMKIKLEWYRIRICGILQSCTGVGLCTVFYVLQAFQD